MTQEEEPLNTNNEPLLPHQQNTDKTQVPTNNVNNNEQRINNSRTTAFEQTATLVAEGELNTFHWYICTKSSS